MAKPAHQATAPQQQTNVVPISHAPPAFLKERMAQDAGKGVSTDQADNQVPLIYVLQKGSPQVDPESNDYIQGAQAGDIWLRGAPNPIVKGSVGVPFQPCYFSKDWVQWVPREAGKGFVGRTPERPAEAKQIKDPTKPNKIIWRLPNGNDVVETRNHAGWVMADFGVMPYVIPLSSTGHTVSRNWMFQMNTKKDDTGKTVPSFATKYLLKTRRRENKDGTWYILDVHDAGYVETAEDYERGKKLFEAFASGEKQAAVPEAEGDHDPAASDHGEDTNPPF